MRLGIGSYTYAWRVGVEGYPISRPMTALDLVNRAVALGVDVVQVADNLPLHALAEAELDRLAGSARDQGVDIEVGTRGIEPAHLRTYLALAKRFQSPILRVVIGQRRPVDQVLAVLGGLCQEFMDAGVSLAIENHEAYRAQELAEIVQALDSRYAGICLDTVNSFGALEGPAEVVDCLAPYVINLHLKDFTIFRAPYTLGYVIEGRPAGQGMTDIPWLLAKLRHHGRDPSVILELWTPPEESVEATMEKEDRWALASIRHLRTLIP